MVQLLEDFDLHGARPSRSRNVVIDGRRTSMRLEEPFWDALQEIATRERRSIGSICSTAARMRDGNLTSAVRVYVLEYWRRPRIGRAQTTARSRSAPERSTDTN